ncbi:PTS system mannose/fructose/N-acetylgalactosamine-transporter subunit IIB [Ligilactobacillus sp.]|uniref:PTS system mannose/fructose/N-acetylgalactosamine-transporter subunit IIB n=1 Tax=Ligilactobacillus sp. TaxID=2767921 RepID=UPI002FE21182
MTLVLARIDQRLIHGIVVTQWAGETKARRLMVVDDIISKDEAQKAAMRMSKPAGTGMSIIDTETAIKNFNAGKYDSHNVFLIVKEPETLLRLLDGGVMIPKVNIGIMFDGPDKKTVKKMVSVNDKEIADFRELMKRGVPVTFRFVPSDPDEPFDKYIRD